MNEAITASVVYDLIGIGIGPFNLGLAAILYDLPELKALFLDQRPGFDWHPGLLLPASRMQVPYFADLVSLVNPQSRFSYTGWLHATGRMFRYANHDNIYPLRIEYNRYCQWVAGQLTSLRFGERVVAVTYDEVAGLYTVETMDGRFHAKHIVLGTGTVPYLPECLTRGETESKVIHAGEYLFHQEALLRTAKVTVLGSGQSAAEIFNDLLPHADNLRQLAWFTRSTRFHPMDYSRFTTELTSPDWIDHFYGLPDPVKARVLREQQCLFKGINTGLIAQINDALYVREVSGGKDNVRIHANCELLSARAGEGVELDFRHTETGEAFTWESDVVIAATGYCYEVPEFIQNLPIRWKNGRYDVQRNYSIDFNNSLFVQNADLHSHGFNSADLGMGPYRNATILNAILGREQFTMEKGTGFQSFGIPGAP